MRAKRNREITIRVTDQELEKMKRRRKGQTLARWLRELALGIAPIKRADPQLILTLGRIGSNLNQIARRANIESSTDAQTLKEIQIIRELMQDLIETNIQQAKAEDAKNDR